MNLDLVDELGIDIEIYEEDYPKLNTIHLIAEYIRARLQEASE